MGYDSVEAYNHNLHAIQYKFNRYKYRTIPNALKTLKKT